MTPDKPTTKHDVAIAFARLLMLLGKNDFAGLTVALHVADATYHRWLRDRPEKTAKVAKAGLQTLEPTDPGADGCRFVNSV